MIKAEIKEKVIDLSYPLLMISKTTGNIVLMVSERKGNPNLGEGFIISLGENNVDWNIGDNDKSWLLPQFEPFYGEITLKNERV